MTFGKTAQPKQAERPREAPPARLGRALRLGLRDLWDRLGTVIALSLSWMVLLSVGLTLLRLLPPSLPLGLRLLLFAALLLLLLPAPFAGACLLAHQMVTHDEVTYGTFWQGTGRHYAVATRLGLLLLLESTLLGINFWFYGRMPHLGGKLAATLCLYLLLFGGMMALYQFPLLILQEEGFLDTPEHRARRGAWAIQRRSLFLALGRPFYSLGACLFLGGITLLFLFTAVPFALLWAGMVALLTTHLTRALLQEYGVLASPPSEEPIPDEQFRISHRITTREE